MTDRMLELAETVRRTLLPHLRECDLGDGSVLCTCGRDGAVYYFTYLAKALRSRATKGETDA